MSVWRVLFCCCWDDKIPPSKYLRNSVWNVVWKALYHTSNQHKTAGVRYQCLLVLLMLSIPLRDDKLTIGFIDYMPSLLIFWPAWKLFTFFNVFILVKILSCNGSFCLSKYFSTLAMAIICKAIGH